jgi:CubicO group peptidase (beta-lactamase class C family)
MKCGPVWLSILAVSLVPAPAALAQRPVWAAAVDSIMRAELARTGAPGGQVAVVERGRVVYSAGYGVADIETGRPVTERTLFQVAGVTNLFTGALLTELHARRLVDLDSPVRRYIPELRGPRTGAATLRGLLSMSSGWINTAGQFGTQDDSDLSAMYSTIGDSMAMTDPGLVFSYSNPSYNVAGLAAERAARRPFADVMDSVVFRPLGLTGAAYRPGAIATRDFSQPHVGAAGEPAQVARPAPGNGSAWPTGFLYVSAGEIARLAVALMNDGVIEGRRIFQAEAMTQMHRGVVLVPEFPADSFALGMHVARWGGRRAWEKSGGMPGWESQVTMWPDDGFAVAASFNRQPALPARVIESIASRVAGIPPRPAVDLIGERDPTPQERAALAGKYGQLTVTSEYFEQDGKLVVRLANTTLPVRVNAAGTHVIVRPPNGPPRITAIVRDSTGAVRFMVRDSRAYRKFF